MRVNSSHDSMHKSIKVQLPNKVIPEKNLRGITSPFYMEHFS